MSERVKAAEVAKRLGVNESSVSRYLRRHPELRDGEGLIDFAAFVAHQAANSATPVGKVDEKERSLKAQADLRELELAERRGELVAKAAVEAVLLDALGEFWAALKQEIPEALSGAGVQDVAAAETAVEECVFRARQAVVERLGEIGRGGGGGGGA